MPPSTRCEDECLDQRASGFLAAAPLLQAATQALGVRAAGRRTLPSTGCDVECLGQRAFGFLATAPLVQAAMQALGKPVRATG
eukprot:5245150-Alexandrium_andersonii.AAC.1